MKGNNIKVRDLIAFLEKCNQNALVTVGDNFYNGISVTCGCAEGCTYEKCEFICFSPCNCKENREIEN